MSFAIVIPTIGRPSLGLLLESLDACTGPRPAQIVIVDDRRTPAQTSPPTSLHAISLPTTSLPTTSLPATSGWTADLVTLRRSGGRGPAAARNVGWRSTTPALDWVVFLDDDVCVTPSWLTDLDADLSGVQPQVAGSQARLVVPLPSDRRPTDFERGTAGLADARWITADMAYRRRVLTEVSGFDERFPRAFREDADIALRITAAGHTIGSGARVTRHPVRPSAWDASLRQQRGNADDALMRSLHGPRWHQQAGAAVGRRPLHLLATASAALAVAAGLMRHRRTASAAALAWLAQTVRFSWLRVAPGPRTAAEVSAMLATSVAIPPSASWHWLRGSWRHRDAPAWPLPLEAVLLDRDATLIRDVAYNGDPEQVEPMPGADKALRRLRECGLKLAVVSNQSGVARGLLSIDQVQAVNAKVEQLLGPFAEWQICPHGEQDGCDCRKPAPGMIEAAATALGLSPWQCAMIGDIGSDVEAALAAGAGLAILVPTAATRQQEVDAAELVCVDLDSAADLIVARVLQ